MSTKAKKSPAKKSPAKRISPRRQSRDPKINAVMRMIEKAVKVPRKQGVLVISGLDKKTGTGTRVIKYKDLPAKVRENPKTYPLLLLPSEGKSGTKTPYVYASNLKPFRDLVALLGLREKYLVGRTRTLINKAPAEVRRSPIKKSPSKKSPAKKSPKKTPAKKSPKKTPAKKSPKKGSKAEASLEKCKELYPMYYSPSRSGSWSGSEELSPRRTQLARLPRSMTINPDGSPTEAERMRERTRTWKRDAPGPWARPVPPIIPERL